MKLNWGNGLLVVIILFILSVVATLIFSLNVKTDLVEKDYYPKELEYQKQIDKIENSNTLENSVTFQLDHNDLIIKYPRLESLQVPEGKILFYRPSDKDLDFEIPVDPDTSLYQTINLSSMVKGKYVVKIDWSLDETEYYTEETIIIQ